MENFRKPGVRYKARDYLKWKEKRKLIFGSVLSAIVCFILMVFAPKIISSISKHGEIIDKISSIGLFPFVTCTIAGIYYMKKELYTDNNYLNLCHDFLKSLAITTSIYFTAALIFSYARFWTVFGYWIVCITIALFSSVMAIGFVILWSSKIKT